MSNNLNNFEKKERPNNQFNESKNFVFDEEYTDEYLMRYIDHKKNGSDRANRKQKFKKGSKSYWILIKRKGE